MPDTQIRTLDLHCRFAAGDAGYIEGIASRWFEPDMYGDVIEPTAFDATLAEHRARGTMPAMLWQHRDPIGVWDSIEPTAEGLKVKGHFALETIDGQQAYAHARAGTTTGLSIQFIYRDASPGPNGTYIVRAVDLIEVSFTPIPAAPRARIQNVRQIIEENPMPEQTPTPDTPATPATPPAISAEAFAMLQTELRDLRTRADEAEVRAQRLPATARADEPSAELRAFHEYLRHGDRATELRTLQVGIDPQGGYLAPAEMSTEFIRDLTEFSPIRGLATVRQTASPSVIYPRRTSATSALWKGELQAAGASEPAFGQVEIPTKELNTYVDVSNQLLADSAGQAEAEVRLALAEDFGKKEGTAFVSGNGALEPEGLLTNADVGYEASGNASSLGSAPADLLITTMYALPAAYRTRGTWLMNGATLASIRKLKDGQGNFLWQPSYVAGQPEMILGRPVVEAPDMPDIGTSKEPIVFGDIASAYRIVDRLALSILVNPYLLATSGITRIHATRRVGAAVVKAAAIRKIRCAVS